jgi:thioesterase DpgC
MTHPRYAGRRVFSAGINLKHLHGGQISFVRFILGREFGYLSKIQRGLIVESDGGRVARCLQKPWLAAVDAFAIGGGLQLLLIFDKVIAEEGAYFSLPAAEVGIVPGAANLRLPRFVGGRAARQIILGGRVLRANEPDARWLCDEVVPASEMDAIVERAATELDNPAVIANRAMLNLGEERAEDFVAYMAEFAYAQAIRLHSPDVLQNVRRAVERAR